MYYIFSQATNKCVMTCDAKPDDTDLASNNLFAIESNQTFLLSNTIMYEPLTQQIYCVEDEPEIKTFNMAYNAVQNVLKKYQAKIKNEVFYENHMYQVDNDSIQRMILARDCLTLTGPVQWIAADNTIQALDKDDFNNILILAAKENDRNARYLRSMKDSINQIKIKYEAKQLDATTAIDMLVCFKEELEGA